MTCVKGTVGTSCGPSVPFGLFREATEVMVLGCEKFFEGFGTVFRPGKTQDFMDFAGVHVTLNLNGLVSPEQ